MPVKVRIPQNQDGLFPSRKRATTGKPRIRKKSKDLPENIVKKQGTDWLNAKGWTVIRQAVLNAGMRGSVKPGTSDLRAERQATATPQRLDARNTATLTQTLYLESKAPGRTPSLKQYQYGMEKIVAGFNWLWFDSLEMLQRKYNELGFDAWVK